MHAPGAEDSMFDEDFIFDDESDFPTFIRVRQTGHSLQKQGQNPGRRDLVLVLYSVPTIFMGKHCK